MSAFADARSLQTSGPLSTDLVILGGGAAGISLALALAGSPFRVVLVESGGMEFDGASQSLYGGAQEGVPYLDLEGSRLRYLGGSTNHWGGWTRPLDALDFEKRDWIEHSGWPISYSALTSYIPRAMELIEAGPAVFDADISKWERRGKILPLGNGGVYTTWFQYSKARNSSLPTKFGERYADELKRIGNLSLILNGNATALRLTPDARSVSKVDIATLDGKKFQIEAKYVVLAMGGIESTRLMLASNDVAKSGIGNRNDLVGRFFADHPIPDEVGTLVLFDGRIAPFYRATQSAEDGTRYRAAFRPTSGFIADNRGHNSLTTVENEIELESATKALVRATADALGVDASDAKAWSLTCGLEPIPDPERRLTLTGEKDALGMPRVKLHNTIPTSSFDAYRRTLTAFGQQLLKAGIGTIRINHDTREGMLSVLNWANHHMGTLRMGEDERTGVVDTNAKVFGVENLYVAGSAIFPNYGASNPTMNLIALTLRLADHLKGRFK